LGHGIFAYHAESMDHAVQIAASDPMHMTGARPFRMLPWVLNEGELARAKSGSCGRGRDERSAIGLFNWRLATLGFSPAIDAGPQNVGPSNSFKPTTVPSSA
jgi:hypothetical protein